MLDWSCSAPPRDDTEFPVEPPDPQLTRLLEAWQGGDADCTATLEDWDSYSKNGSITPLASMTFPVYG